MLDEHPIVTELRDRLRDATRDRGGLSRVAGAADIHKATLSRFLSGDRSMSVDYLEALANHFGLEVALRKRKER